MKLREPYALPPDKEAKLQKARRLEWATIAALLSITAVMYLAMGSSQAMKTAWIEDVLSLIPPVLFLVALRKRSDPPSARFPYGHRRVVVLAFLGAAVALLLVGLFVLYDGVTALVMAEHPTIGAVRLFGREVWMGWVMIAALVYSVALPVVLGRMKLPLAKATHEKVLYADADMNKADWTTGLAAIAGLLGVGVGLWWADAVAAVAISLNIVRDGAKNLTGALEDLMDKRPTGIDGERLNDLPIRLRERLLALDWVADADVRLREEGHVVSGEAFVVPTTEEGLVENLARAAEDLSAADWRVYEVVVIPVASLGPQAFLDEEQEGKGGGAGEQAESGAVAPIFRVRELLRGGGAAS
jgi:cation diffusion facilitator family transporter